MSISYDKERDGWSLKDATQEEIDQLLELGKRELLSYIGAGMIGQLAQREQDAMSAEEAIMNLADVDTDGVVPN